ncbi:MAG: hypothetical protein DWI22_12180 [Planctomycetota bacterium]|nr:MAG: hypothetical protein DWI22_12180 [Planctomycetota bacterium]
MPFPSRSTQRRFAGFNRRILLSLAVICFAPAVNGQTKSEEKKAEKGFTLIEEGTRPLATVTFASADRFVEEARYIFDAAGTPEAFKLVEDWLSGSLNDLEGFNREKPFGVMVYLPVAFPPLPEFIAFVPVDSVEAATKLVEKAPVVISKTSEEGRYEVIGPNRTYPILLRDGYAFMPLGNNPPEEALDRKLPNPAQLLASQAQQFDVSVSLDVDSLPIATRTLLMSVITAGISTQLQQRDGEPEGAYRIRKTEGARALDALNQFIMDCQKITIGFDVVQEEHAVNIDFVIDALEGTKLLKEILQSTERPSYFIPLLDENAAVSLSMSSMMADRDKEAYIEMMDGIRMEVTRLIEKNKLGATPDENSPIGKGLSAIQKSLEVGHVDVFAQFYRDSSGKLAIVGASRVEEGDAMGAGLLDAMTRLKDVDEIKQAGTLQIGSGEHQGITFHRLTFAQQPAEAVEVFGKDIGMTVGVGARSVWAVLGGDESYNTLKGVMDQLEESNQTPQEFRTPPNFRVIMNINQLVEMATIADTVGKKAREAREQAAGAEATTKLENPTPSVLVDSSPGRSSEGGNGGDSGRDARRADQARRRERGGKIFRETLAEGDDRIEIDSRLTETGARLRIRLEEGFVKIFGRLLANGLAPQEQTEQESN